MITNISKYDSSEASVTSVTDLTKTQKLAITKRTVIKAFKIWAQNVKNKSFEVGLFKIASEHCNNIFLKNTSGNTGIYIHNFIFPSCFHTIDANKNIKTVIAPSAIQYLILPNLYPAGLYNYNLYDLSINTFDKAKERLSLINKGNSEWFKKSAEYIKNLTVKESYTILGYTHIGDGLINSYMRGTFDVKKFKKLFGLNKIDIKAKITFGLSRFPFEHSAYTVLCNMNIINLHKCVSENCEKDFDYIINILNAIRHDHKQSQNKIQDDRILMVGWCLSMYFWSLVMKDFIKTLDTIIKKCPPLEADIYVYRGSKTPLFTGEYGHGRKKLYSGKPGDMYENSGFVSTALDINIAKAFYGRRVQTGHIQRIKILKGYRVLPTLTFSFHKEETEILLPRNATYVVREMTKSHKFFEEYNCDKVKLPLFDIVLV